MKVLAVTYRSKQYIRDPDGRIRKYRDLTVIPTYPMVRVRWRNRVYIVLKTEVGHRVEAIPYAIFDPINDIKFYYGENS